MFFLFACFFKLFSSASHFIFISPIVYDVLYQVFLLHVEVPVVLLVMLSMLPSMAQGACTMGGGPKPGK